MDEYVWALLVGCVGSLLIGTYFGMVIALNGCATADSMQMRVFLVPVECKWGETK